MSGNLSRHSQEKACKCSLRQKLNEFYTEGRFCDVIVVVQEQTFPCHRVVLASVSEYFDALFRNNEKDYSILRTVLRDISAAVFEELLKFSYTEKEPSITNGNVFDLLSASDFLGMQSFLERCVNYIRQHKSSIENIFEIFSFAQVTNNESLMKIIRDFMIKKFNKISQREEFVTISVEVLKMILEEYGSSYTGKSNSALNLSQIFRDEDALLDALIRWVEHSPGERAVHSEDIMRVVDFRKISLCYREFLLKKFKINRIVHPVSLKKDLFECLASNDSIRDDFVTVRGNIRNLGLHVYMDSESPDFIGSIELNVFSTNKYKSKWSFRDHKDPSPYKGAYMKVISLGESHNYLYSLRYSYYDQDIPTFFASTSVTLDLKHRLASPLAAYFGGPFQLCGMPNSKSIYLYYFNGGAINQYNCDIDRWFPVIEMSHTMRGGCMVADGDLLYFVGGFKNDDESGGACVQAYDRRAPKWLNLSSTNISHRYAAATSLNGKIYVSDARSLEVLDPVAGKWEVLSFSLPIVNTEEPCLKKQMIVAYENRLWIASFEFYEDFEKNKPVDTFFSLEVFNPRLKTWQTSKSLNDISLNLARRDNEKGYRNVPDYHLQRNSFIRDFIVF